MTSIMSGPDRYERSKERRKTVEDKKDGKKSLFMDLKAKREEKKKALGEFRSQVFFIPQTVQSAIADSVSCR